MSYPIEKTEEQWRSELTPEQFEILRRQGTERPFTGEYDKHFETGQYLCAACQNPLFDSVTKFDAGCGWPSFDKALPGAMEYHEDERFGMKRIEFRCARCGGHLGHVFDDGPTETGKRFCTNSRAITFTPTSTS
jgi:peptide-methionine (R)-S-oxide reductase